MCKRAYIFARKNPDVAFEVLLSGQQIPTEAQLAQAVGANGGDAGTAEQDYGDEVMGDDPSGGLAGMGLDQETMQAIQALVNNPSFPMIRQRIQQDPAFG